MTVFTPEPYLRGVLKIAPISNKGAVSLTPENVTNLDLIRPLQDIIDICGTNPTSIVFGINTNSSEESGRTSDLNMHKDILGRVRSFEIEMPPLKREGYQNLQELLMDLTENIDYSNLVQMESNLESGSREYIKVSNSSDYQGFIIYAKMRNEKTGWVGTINAELDSNTNGEYEFSIEDYYNSKGASLKDEDELKALKIKISDEYIEIAVGPNYYFQTADSIDDEDKDKYLEDMSNNYGYTFLQVSANIEVTPTITNENYAYVVWYLIEFMSPETNTVIREIVYVGDSSFTNIKPYYQPNITYDENGAIKTLNEIYVKDLKINLIAKTAKAKQRF